MKGLVMATLLEARPFIDGLGLVETENKPVRMFGNDRLLLAISGIGKINSAIATVYLIASHGPELLYNLGAAGAAKKNYSVGQILHVDDIIEYDRPTIAASSLVHIRPDVMDGFETATLATQDRPVKEPRDREAVAAHAGIVDMEGAAFARSCRAFRIPAFLFKIVTDTESHATDGEIIENIKNTRDLLYNFFVQRIMNSNRN
ncbi:MAG: hypothetical protein MUD12_04640 [Spirochaetes bacterium]|jgi:adenosylhomocysteine nucleosidase|nr:hypothetical protein [Spirochaetota bacterium]